MARSTCLLLRRPVAIHQAEARELFPHLIEVEAELARLQALPSLRLPGLARGAGFGDVSRFQPGHDAYPVVVGNDHVSRVYESACADDGDVHATQSLLHGALRRNDFRPDGEAHLGEIPHVAHPGIDHERTHTMSLQRAGQELAEVAGIGVRGRRDDEDVSVAALLDGYVD